MIEKIKKLREVVKELTKLMLEIGTLIAVIKLLFS